MEFFVNIWNSIYSEMGILVLSVMLVSVFTLYALDLIANELNERRIHGILHKRFDIDEYLKEVSELIAKSRKKSRIARYSIYKAVGLYYKGENENSLEWLKKVTEEVDSGEDVELKIIYTIILFKILFRIGYNEKVEQIYQEKQKIVQKMLAISSYKHEAEYIIALHEFKQGNFKMAREKFIEVKKMPISKLDRTMVSYQLAQICLELDKIEEAEKEVEEVMKTKKKNRNFLFVYDELDKIIKDRRSSNNTISSVDKDLEEQQQKEALEKMQKEVEEAISETPVAPEEGTVDAEINELKEKEELEKSVNQQLEELKKNITEEMRVEQKIGENNKM